MPCQMQVHDCDPMSCLFSIRVVAEDVVLTFHLTSRTDELANICVAWRRKVFPCFRESQCICDPKISCGISHIIFIMILGPSPVHHIFVPICSGKYHRK